MAAPQTGSRSTQAARKYPPVVALFFSLFLAAFILPSALNLPQTNPTQQLEFAPVPPSDEDTPPPIGNFNALNLAEGEGLEAGGAAGGDDGGGPLQPPPIIQGKTPSTKKCVGNPPRQTEDPLSPPCVPDFNCKDNFGETYQGVTASEIRILIYTKGFTRYLNTSEGQEPTPDNTYWDLAEPPKPEEHLVVRYMRAYQRYFFDRYQTYCRNPHFFVYFSGQDTSPETRRAEAADNFNRVKPFAVLVFDYENADAYLEAMAKRGVLNFASLAQRELTFFQRYPKLIWGYLPALEFQAKQFSSYVCRKVVPYKSSFAGPALNGRDRRIGIYYTSDNDRPELRKLKELVVEQIKACGANVVIERTFPSACCVQDNRYPPDYAAEAMNAFQGAGVTTIIWPGGVESNGTKAAGRLGYLPEWLIVGDRTTEGSNFMQYQDPTVVNGHAFVVSNATYVTPIEEALCFQAQREADPTIPQNDAFWGCFDYADVRQLFIGIQVAGPRLGPTSIDKGFHAIPKVASTNPQVPACFYEPGDYTCTKDSIAMWYDSSGDSENDDTPGCWRLTEGGKRYLSGTWPHGDVIAQKAPGDVCNNYNESTLINPNPPSVG